MSKVLRALGNISNYHDHVKVFLAGGMDTNWRSKIVNDWATLTKNNNNVGRVLFVDPTRHDWDSSWTTKYNDSKFYQQTKWEMATMRHCDYIIVHLTKGSQAPISLVEMAMHFDKVLLVKEEGFWKEGYVDIMCEEYGIAQFESLDKVLEFLQVSL